LHALQIHFRTETYKDFLVDYLGFDMHSTSQIFCTCTPG